MRLRLVHAPGSNLFMREILEGIAFEARRAGVDAAVVDGDFPEGDDTAYVVVPHEYFVVHDPRRWPDADQLARTVALTVEHPGTPWFEVTATQARRCAAVMDINDDSTAELRRRGLTVTRFQVGYTASIDHWGGVDAPRSTDIVYLGSADDRRDAALASYARGWTRHRARLLLPSEAPRTRPRADYLVGGAKHRLLADSSVLVNLHRGGSRALEWVRVVEAVANGCVVVSEHSVDAAPLVPGVHFLSASIGAVGHVTSALLDDPDRLAALRTDAHDFLRHELPLAPAVERLLELADELVRRPRPATGTTAPGPAVAVPAPPVPRPLPWEEHVADTATRLGSQVRALRRRLAVLEIETARAAGRAGPTRDGVVPVTRTSAFARAEPSVSVVVPLYDKSRFVVEALDSAVAAAAGTAVELLVLDDRSTDDSVPVVQRWLHAHDHVPAVLLRQVTNTGPAHARNRLLARARGELVFTLDADNGVYPTAFDVLTDALEQHPDASFAYGPIEVRQDGRPVGLTSSRPLAAEDLRYGNYVDNMAMFRTSALRAVGGWDETLDTWEDFDLWLRLLEAEHHGVFVPQVHSWYRLQPATLRMSAGIDMPGLWARLRAAAPSVLGA